MPYIPEVCTGLPFSALLGLRPSTDWPVAIPEKLSLARSMFSWAWPCRLKRGLADMSSAYI